MKKTLLAAALFAGFAGFAGAAQAETQVTLYGILDTGLEFNSVKNVKGVSYSTVGLDSGNQSGSRWGMKGTEDLGGGTQATFQLESGFQVTNGYSNQSQRLFGRRAFLGMQNPSWGMFRVGRGPTVATDMFQNANTDPFAYGFGPFQLGQISTATNTYRTDNQIGYMSPVFAGFQIGAGYSFNVNNANPYTNVTYPGGVATTANSTAGVGEPMANRAQGFDLSGTYTNGPLLVALSYDQTNPYATSSATTGNVRQVTLDGSYNFQVVTLYGAYVRGWNGLVGAPSGQSLGDGGYSALTTATGGNAYISGLKQNAFMLGVSAPIGTATSLFASWQHQTLGGKNNTWQGTAENTFGVGASYSLSKRTNLYAVAGYIDGLGNIYGQKEVAGIVGMRHQF